MRNTTLIPKAAPFVARNEALEPRTAAVEQPNEDEKSSEENDQDSEASNEESEENHGNEAQAQVDNANLEFPMVTITNGYYY